MPDVACGVFLRVPEPGRVKTRLASAIGTEAAYSLYCAFVLDTLNSIQRLANTCVVLFVAGSPTDPRLQALLQQASTSNAAPPTSHSDAAAAYPAMPSMPPATRVQPPHELDREPQPEGGLGLRMEAALQSCLRRAPKALLVGTDAPTLPLALLDDARSQLDHHPVVLVPAADGGYCLLGARATVEPPLASGIRYSTPHALRDTRESLRRSGLSSGLTSPWYDVDTAEDLRLLRTELALDPTRAPHTAHHLGLVAQH